MDDEKLKILIEKFPSVLKRAIEEEKIDLRNYEPECEIEGIPLFRGVYRKVGDSPLPLKDSDFLSQAEQYRYIQKYVQAESDCTECDMDDDIKTQVEILKTSKRFSKYRENSGCFSCSFFKDYGKLTTFIEKANEGKFVIKGLVNKSQGFFSEQHGTESHVHAFLYENHNLKASFEVVDGNT